MTHNVCDDLGSLLRPVSLLPAAAILDNPVLVPNVRGIYAWWFKGNIPGVPLDETLIQDGHRLLYVGIAPRAPSRAGSTSASTLRRRFRNHLRGRLATSTLRKSLACLLGQELGFHITRNAAGKLVMPRDHEAALTRWMGEHAAVTFLANDAPWTIEDELIASGPSLPLNIKGSAHPFREILSRKRRGYPSSNCSFAWSTG